MGKTDNAKLVALAQKWANTARCKFKSAEAEEDAFARRFIEHGAICYFNAASELLALLEADGATDLELDVFEQHIEGP